MKTDRALDRLVAEKVMGLAVVERRWGKEKQCGSLSIGEPDYCDVHGELLLTNELPEYSTDIGAAWEVVKSMNRSEAYEFELKLAYDGVWFCNIMNIGS